MQFAARTAPVGTSMLGTNFWYILIPQPGSRHTKNAAMMMATSIAALRSALNRLDISYCWELTASPCPPTWASMAFICLFAVLYTYMFRNTITRNGTGIIAVAINITITFLMWTNYSAQPILVRSGTPLGCKSSVPNPKVDRWKVESGLSRLEP